MNEPCDTKELPTSPPLSFVEAVTKVLNAQPTSEQQAKKAARKALAEEKRKRKRREEDRKSAP